MTKLATGGSIRAIEGSEIAVEAQSICVHGDTPAAVGIARALRDALLREGLSLRAFTDV
jgi:5-oxoprolinase (ATP-hydrolysing) subunit A